MSRWDCWVQVNRHVEVEADDEAMAKAEALHWFFEGVVHVIDERNVSVHPITKEGS